MATQNAIGSQNPIEVSKGGTGANTLTDHGVLVGSGTSAITSLTVGSTGELLVGSTSNNPSFSTSADGNFTFTSATAGVGRSLAIINSDNSNIYSSSTMFLSTGGSSAGDPTVKFTVTGVANYSLGIDNSDEDKLKISNSTDLGTNDSWIMTPAGERTMPLQPAFSAYLSSTVSNVTGNGTTYSIIFDTEIFDQNSDYNNSTGVFTAPVTGRYFLCSTVHFISDATSGGTQCTMHIFTSNRLWVTAAFPTARRVTNFLGPNDAITYNLIAFADMDAGDTAQIRIQSESGSLVDDIYGAASPYTCFCGYLVV